jgi:hypothetical protein
MPILIANIKAAPWVDENTSYTDIIKQNWREFRKGIQGITHPDKAQNKLTELFRWVTTNSEATDLDTKDLKSILVQSKPYLLEKLIAADGFNNNFPNFINWLSSLDE